MQIGTFIYLNQIKKDPKKVNEKKIQRNKWGIRKQIYLWAEFFFCPCDFQAYCWRVFKSIRLISGHFVTQFRFHFY